MDVIKITTLKTTNEITMIHSQKLLILVVSIIHQGVAAFHHFTTGITSSTKGYPTSCHSPTRPLFDQYDSQSIRRRPLTTWGIDHSLFSIYSQRYRTRLYSINSLIESIEEQVSKQSKEQPGKQQQTILVGGKGGVGKTTTSAAIAIELASTHPQWNILIVSTDPAHSLGDALDIDLQKQKGQITVVDDPIVTQGRLFAQEINADIALEEFRTSMSSIMDIQQLSSILNVSPDLLDSLGIQELQSLIQNPPPGLDELVALSNVFSSSLKNNDNNNKELPYFDVVIVDTAPTGHTLRLLALPQFLNGLVGKLIKFRLKLTSIASTLQSMFSSSTNNGGQERQSMIDTAMNRIEEFQQKVVHLRSMIQNSEFTKFVVVTIPTQLAVAESKRLINELQSQSITVSDLIINQCIVNNESDTDSASSNDKLINYYNRRVTGQQKWIQTLEDAVQKVSQSTTYQQNIGTTNGSTDNVQSSTTTTSNVIEITQVPFFDVELVGIPALGYIGSQVYINNPKFDHLLLSPNTNNQSSSSSSTPKVVICGGKGGVGKTTSSASLAVAMAICGHKVALISTDPAHSLGDAVQMNLNGGQLEDCPLIGVPGASNNEVGSLSVLEIDPTASLNQFKDVVNQLMGNSNNNADSSGSNIALREAVKDLQDIFDTLPAGTDEVVALAKIINLVKKGGFDRIVLDTAPTGHTLRMLSTPGFLADLIERLLRISDKLNSNNMVQLMLLGTTTAQRRDEIKNAIETAKSTLLSFQLQMYDLEDLFANAQQTEFMIVTVPTELAVRESMRLLNDLTYDSPDMPIKVRNVIINQVLNDDSDNDSTESFLSHISVTQSDAINHLKQFVQTKAISDKNAVTLTQIPYLDVEPRGIFGLKVLAAELTKVIVRENQLR
jgi:arsenite/tail-anchored protein-transporting ATPase